MNSLVNFFIDLFGGISKDLIIFIISLMPILELRGGLLAASLLHVEFVRPVQFVLLVMFYLFQLFYYSWSLF